MSILLASLAAYLAVGQPAAWAQAPGAAPAASGKPEAKPAEKDPYAWKDLFDGKTLDGWKVPNYGGQGEVTVEDGAIVLGMGNEITGITWTGELPKENYEIRLEGMRAQGIDFFCTTTFPIGDEPCSLVVGGWAGTVVGLSCVDWYDASDNITSQFIGFKDGQWYRVRIRVTEEKVQAWIDDEKLVDLERKGHKFSIRDEVDLSVPLGICTWCTEGHVRNIQIRRLRPEETGRPAEPEKGQTAADAEGWKSLFDGKSLGQWEVVDVYDFKNHGDVRVEDGRIVLGAGRPAAGIKWTGEFPRIDYEVALEGMRVEGSDFFCSMTFPVAETYLSMIVGGWGGSTIGLSNIDDEPAVENESATFKDFSNKTWYRVRLRVTRARIEAWIDDEKLIDVPNRDRKFDIWWEQEPLRPFGIATWYTTGAVRNIRLRHVESEPTAPN